MSSLSCSLLFEPHYGPAPQWESGVGGQRTTSANASTAASKKSIFEDRTQDLMRWDEYVVLYSPSAVPHPIEEQTCKSALMVSGVMHHHQ